MPPVLQPPQPRRGGGKAVEQTPSSDQLGFRLEINQRLGMALAPSHSKDGAHRPGCKTLSQAWHQATGRSPPVGDILRERSRWLERFLHSYFAPIVLLSRIVPNGTEHPAKNTHSSQANNAGLTLTLFSSDMMLVGLCE